MAKQVTLDITKSKLTKLSADRVEERLQYLANYAVAVSPVDTGAYVESFSLGPAGFGGGRSKSSDARHTGVKKGGGGANPETFRAIARENLTADIQGLNIQQAIANGNAKFTLRNRAPHAMDVEDGSNWKRQDGYYVFTKIKRKFG